MSKNDTFPEIPRAEAFRVWVRDAFEVLEIKPAAASRAIGASINAVGAFLRQPDRDITLSRASDLERFLRRTAREKSITLPAIRRRALTVKGPDDG